MGEKDLTEKILEDYNDVFADIMNALVFKGKDVVHPDSLRNSSVHSQYKADDQKLHELERDVAKYWMDGNVQIALCGMENQTEVEKFMPFRVFSYDGTAYRSQLLDQENKIVPVITIVLYFGNEHWTAPKNIKYWKSQRDLMNMWMIITFMYLRSHGLRMNRLQGLKAILELWRASFPREGKIRTMCLTIEQ